MNFFTKNLWTILAGVLVLAGLYWYFESGSPAAPLSGSVPSASETQFLTLTGELNPISFDTSIFTDPRFNALQDISTPVSPEPQGRTDPFAPLGRGQ